MPTLTSRRKDWIASLATGVVCALFLSVAVASVRAQTKPGAAQAATAQKLSEQESRGEGLFLQRCSLCHLPRKLKFGSPPVVGPSLSGLFKEADADQQKFLRGLILKGDPKMPGFQYGLEPNEVDDLIAYLKTL
jgi:mono/diheme cytochrome c family protein